MLYDVGLGRESGNGTQKVPIPYILMRVGMEQEQTKVKLRQSNQQNGTKNAKSPEFTHCEGRLGSSGGEKWSSH